MSNIIGKNNYYIKDSFSFKHFIDTINIPHNYKIISLDVISMYTNIPNELITTVLKTKWNLLKEHTTLSCNEFIEGILLIQNNNYYQYKDNFYQQLGGCTMGSPISSTLAQLVMEHLEEGVLGNLDFNVLFFKRFVDDCIAAIPSDKINNMLNSFNSFHPKLQFTIETENNAINFLDLTLIRTNDNKIKTKLYQKETWSGRYLNYYSNHPNAQKNSVIVGLTDRAIKLTSPEYHPEVLKHIKNTLKNNHYPIKNIERIFKQRTYKFYNNNKNNQKQTQINNNRYISIPYTNQLSEKLKYVLSKHNIKVCHRTQNTLSPLFTKLKSPIKTKKNLT